MYKYRRSRRIRHWHALIHCMHGYSNSKIKSLKVNIKLELAQIAAGYVICPEIFSAVHMQHIFRQSGEIDYNWKKTERWQWRYTSISNVAGVVWRQLKMSRAGISKRVNTNPNFGYHCICYTSDYRNKIEYIPSILEEVLFIME